MNNGPKDGNWNAPGSPYASYGPPRGQGAVGFEETRLLEDPSQELQQTAPISPHAAQQAPAPSASPAARGGINPKDIASEKTILHDDIKGSLGAMAKLVILEGMQQGKEFPILEQTVSFGRERDNTISFPDLSVSRYHFKIHRKPNGHDLEGLSDGNPTLLNGKATRKATLKHGDRIQAGKTLLQYLMLGQPNAPVEAKSNMAIFLVLGLVLLSGGIGAGIFLFSGRKTAQDDSKKQMVTEAFEEGLNLYRQRKWRDAEIAFERALSHDSKRMDIKQYIRDARSENDADLKLKKVRLLIADKNYKEAKEALTDIEEKLAPGSVYAEDLLRLQSNVRKALAPAVVVVVPPVRNGGTKPHTRTRWVKKNGRWVRASAPAPTPPPTTVTPAVPAAKTPEQIALESFAEGDLNKAKDLLIKAGNSNKANQIDQFREAYSRGKSSHNNRIHTTAIPALEQALQIDQELGLGKSLYTVQLRKMLANMYSMAGLMAFSERQYGSAYSSFRKALKQRPDHIVSKSKIEEIQAEAQGWLSEAQKAKGTAAKTYLLRITNTLPQTDPICKQAKALLKQFE